jgi:hypothetical protein
MPKVFDEQGAVVEVSGDTVFNDLTKAPILDDIPDPPVYYVIATKAENGILRLSLIMPKVIATVKALQDMVKTLTDKINIIQLTSGPKGDPGKDGLNGLSGKDGTNGLPGVNGTNGKDGVAGTNGKDGVPTRVERYSSFSTDATGVVTIVFSTPFTALPDCDVVESWTSTTPPQQVVGSVIEGSVTLTGCKA